MAFSLAAAAAAMALEGTLLGGGVLELCCWDDSVPSGAVMSHFERRFFLGGSSSL